MSSGSFRRSLQRPGLLGGLLVAATLGLAGALAYQAVRAAASHRAAVEAALEHHATSAAWRFAGAARNWIGYGMNEAGAAIQRELARGAGLPGPEVVQRVLARKYCDCMTAVRRGRWSTAGKGTQACRNARACVANGRSWYRGDAVGPKAASRGAHRWRYDGRRRPPRRIGRPRGAP